MQVEIWSDVVCPWCYVGERRFEAALARFDHREEVEVRWRSFELDPTSTSAPHGTPVGPDDQAGRLAAKFGSSVEQARGMLASMTATAAEVGVEMRFDRTVPANTVDAHQVAHLAHAVGGAGLQAAVVERLMRGHFTDGEAVGDREVLVRLAAEAGLDADEVRTALEQDRHLGDVRADEAEARALGITGVPFFVVDRKYGVSGAQSPEVLLGALERAWAERSPQLVDVTPAGSATTGAADDVQCGPDGCPV